MVYHGNAPAKGVSQKLYSLMGKIKSEQQTKQDI